MVSVKNLAESGYVNVGFVGQNNIKTGIITSEGKITSHEKYGDKLVLDVEIDKEPKCWALNKPTLRNFVEAWGNDSKKWVGKKVNLTVIIMDGNQMVLGAPVEE